MLISLMVSASSAINASITGAAGFMLSIEDDVTIFNISQSPKRPEIGVP